MARDRYLWNAGEETINKVGAEIKADTPRSKWQNFWYYHKLHVVFGAIAVFLVWSFAAELLSRVDPDYQIAIVTNNSYLQSFSDAMGEALEPYGKDRNGDGEVVVQVNVYSLTDSASASSAPEAAGTGMVGGSVDNAYYQMAGITRYMADLQAGDSMIYIMDDENFLLRSADGVFAYAADGSDPPEGADDYQNMRIPWGDCAALEKLSESWVSTGQCTQEFVDEYVSPLGVSIRAISRTTLEGQDGIEQKHADYWEFLNRLAADEPLPDAGEGSGEA